MEMMDRVEVIAEKEEYAREGIHKGMQGWICDSHRLNNAWLVNFPAFGPEADLAEAPILEEDLMKIPAMDAQVSQRIQAEFAAKKHK